MRLVARRKAAEQVGAIYDYIAGDNHRDARAMVDRIYARAERIADRSVAHSGRPGRRSGARELIEPPYILVYRVDEACKEIVFLSIVHGARRR